MIENFVITSIKRQLPFLPNEGQEELLSKLATFLLGRSELPAGAGEAFLLRGYAGTGKTSVVSALVKAMHLLQQRFILLAPTGRAAKVIASYSGFPAYTIHKKIYRQEKMGSDHFGLSDNLHQHTLFIVDEASMISTQRGETVNYGTGCLLDDLVHYVYSGNDCRLLLLGDTAQLPPVGQIDSPALSADYMAGYGLHVTEHVLTQVARQALDSGILLNATHLRDQLSHGQVELWPQLETEGHNDIIHLPGNMVVETVERAYHDVGAEETIIVTRTNRRTNLYNQGVRAQILWKEDEISGGDRVMVCKNNYYWTRLYEGIDFLANGDMFEIERIRNFRELYGFRFADAELRAVDYDWTIDATIWLDTLTTDSPEANYQLQRQLFERIAEDYPEIRNKRDLMKKIMEDPYYNALQVRFAYAVTCHKAQGGQWKRVFIDPGNIADEQLGEDFYRWLYTAITRSREQVYLINFEKTNNQ